MRCCSFNRDTQDGGPLFQALKPRQCVRNFMHYVAYS